MVEPPNGDISKSSNDNENIDFTPIPYKPIPDENVEMNEPVHEGEKKEKDIDQTENTVENKSNQDDTKSGTNDVEKPNHCFDQDTEKEISSLLQKKSVKRENENECPEVKRWKSVKENRKKESIIHSYLNVIVSSVLYGCVYWFATK